MAVHTTADGSAARRSAFEAAEVELHQKQFDGVETGSYPIVIEAQWEVLNFLVSMGAESDARVAMERLRQLAPDDRRVSEAEKLLPQQPE